MILHKDLLLNFPLKLANLYAKTTVSRLPNNFMLYISRSIMFHCFNSIVLSLL